MAGISPANEPALDPERDDDAGERIAPVYRSLAEQLAQRTENLSRSDAIRRAVTLSATELLRSLDLDHSIPHVLELVGTSAGVSRIAVYENKAGPNGPLAISRRFSWDGPDVAATGPAEFQHVDLVAEGFGPLLAGLSRGEVQTVVAREAAEPFRRILDSLGVLSALIVPIFVDGKWWGEMKVGDCRSERSWSPIEIDTFRTVAELAATAVARARDLRALSDAGQIVENSPVILYRLAAESPFGMTYVSRNVSRYGYSQEDLLAQPSCYLDLIHPDDLPEVMADIVRVVEGRVAEVGRERRVRIADGSYVWFEDRTRAVYDGDRHLTAIEGILVDINERKTAAALMTRIALTDQLTGLANRAAFVERIAQACAAARHGAKPFAVLYLDLDRFKDINDTLGHTKGDELLKAMAERLGGLLRDSDVLARFGGDEFAVLASEITDPSVAGALATRILRAMDRPFNVGSDIHVTASIGISVYGPEIARPEDMLKQADLALYRAKDSGRNQYHFHSEELDFEVRERVTLADDLRLALERGELELYYQPQVELPSGKIVGLEALARWNHPTRGLVWPGRFIPIAEKTGAIVPLGRWVTKEACRQITVWRAEKLRVPTVAVNLSAAQIRSAPDFDRELAQTFREWGLEPSAIEIELTESVLMETTREHSAVVERLRELGVSIAIDDFGTGYSSLEYLRAYRVSRIKIAQEFIRDLETDPGDVAIVRAAISLARELGIDSIAEGVETAAQLALLKQAGCRYVQGYYFSRPVPARRAAKLLREGKLVPAKAARPSKRTRPARTAEQPVSAARKNARGGRR